MTIPQFIVAMFALGIFISAMIHIADQVWRIG